MPDSFVFLFGKDRLPTILVGRGEYSHSFGGGLECRIVSTGEDHGVPVRHLVHLDLDDPAVPISISQVSQLPLLYVFDSRTVDFAYRLRPGNCVETFFPHIGPPGTYEVEGPYNSTDEFPRSDIIVADCEFDPTNVDDVFTWGASLESEHFPRKTGNA